jgi:hypothetical protein
MRIFYTAFLSMLFFLTSNAQTFEVDTLLKNGPILERINLVFLGDGYTEGEQDKFVIDVNAILNELFSQAPFKNYKNYFNAYAVKVISQESGASHPRTSADPDCAPVPQKTVNNYFGSQFDNSNIHRLLYPTNMSAIIGVLANNFPLYDLIFVAVNTPYYGGAGGFVATCSSHPSGRDVAIHEIGHSFALLADEYWAGFGSERPNMTQQTNPSLVKWKNWMGVSGVGIYGHGQGITWKKPHQNCKMGVLGVPLCKVCCEAFVEQFHVYVRPISNFLPADDKIHLDLEEEQDIYFSVSLVLPNPNTLKITWEKDDAVISKNIESIVISSADIVNKSTIRVTVMDTTAHTRSEVHETSHLYVIEWEIFKGDVVTGTEIETKAKQYNLSAYPNPAEGDLKFKYELSKPTSVTITLLDSNGQKVRSLIDSKQLAGAYEYNTAKSNLHVPPGAYIVQFNFGKTIIPIRIIIL